MSAEHERSSRFYEPFGDVGAEIADFAKLLGESLAQAPEVLDSSEVMPSADAEALEHWLVLEHLVPMMAVPEELDGVVRKQGHDVLSVLHTAMPYSEAERGWLLRLYRQPNRPEIFVREPEALPTWLATQEARIMSAGAKRVVSGRDLMRRWTAWRRQSGEFEGQGSLDEARAALRGVQWFMKPGFPLTPDDA